MIFKLQISVLKNTALTISNFRSANISFTIFLILLLSIWIFGFLSPLIAKIENPFIQFLLARIYSRVCHQDAAKCISLGGEIMFVCSRCAGIYFGALSAGILALLYKIPELTLKHLTILSLPLMLHVALTFTGIYSYSKMIAFITGICFGSAVSLIFFSEVKQLISKYNYKNE